MLRILQLLVALSMTRKYCPPRYINQGNCRFNYEITKYSPIYRNEFGHYKRDDWISVADIGTIYYGAKFTLDQYLEIEDAYVQAIMIFMDFHNLKMLTLANYNRHSLGKHAPITKSMLINYLTNFAEKELTRDQICDLIRLCLREDVGLCFENTDLIVHFDWNYYMNITSSKELPNNLQEEIESLGLFIRNYPPYYLFDHDDIPLGIRPSKKDE